MVDWKHNDIVNSEKSRSFEIILREFEITLKLIQESCYN